MLTIENLTNNGELETCDRQLLIRHNQPSLKNLVNSNLSNRQLCDCEKETEFEFCLVKLNSTVEEFKCSAVNKF